MTTDENWALTLAERANGKQVGFWFLVGGGLTLWFAWTLSSVVGVIFAQAIPAPETYGIDFAFTAAFIAIACSLWQGRSDILPWLVSIGTVVMLIGWGWVDASWAIVGGGMSGALTGAFVNNAE